MALRASIAGVISTVNRKECLKQPRAHYEAKMDDYMAMIAEYGTKVQAIDAEITTIKAGEVHEVLDTGSYSRSRQQQTRFTSGHHEHFELGDSVYNSQ